uniref:Transposase n=1 Tax=Bursaphelenchus xylophilus TaxID=6326 RepID=A0A1I7SPG4_BURXY
MYIGRSINNFSVYLAFLDRSEHFTLHQLRHFGWMNKTIGSPVPKRSANHALEIGARLEQFERFVTFLMHAFLNNSQKETRENKEKVRIILMRNGMVFGLKFLERL